MDTDWFAAKERKERIKTYFTFSLPGTGLIDVSA
jgi:hypothetical protein